jgi:hypothetical protein
VRTDLRARWRWVLTVLTGMLVMAGDLGEFELFGEAHEEDGALVGREVLEGGVDLGGLFLDEEAGFGEDSWLGRKLAASVMSMAVARAWRQKRNFWRRCWSRMRLTAMEVSQVLMEQSPRKRSRAL